MVVAVLAGFEFDPFDRAREGRRPGGVVVSDRGQVGAADEIVPAVREAIAEG
jgi:hypothetical protein